MFEITINGFKMLQNGYHGYGYNRYGWNGFGKHYLTIIR